jgi:sterol 3beta-glucosyltransferase
MHITILALGSRGDVLPYAALGRGLVSAGHTVRFITFATFQPEVARWGMEFHPIQGDAQALVAQGGGSSFRLARSFGTLAASYAQDLSAPQLGETDILINQLPGGLYGSDLAEKFHLIYLQAAVLPLTPTTDFPLMGFPRLPLPGYNHLTYRVGEQLVWSMFHQAINHWRKHSLHLAPLPLRSPLNPPVPMLYGFSPLAVPRPADWGDHIHLTGYWFPTEPEWQPPPSLEAFLENGDPPVFVGFGSMPVRYPARLTRLILQAVRQSGQRAVLHRGWGGIGEGELPPWVYRLTYAPYAWLFARVRAVVHHGGSGTTAFALRAGVPSMAVPFVFDQFFWGRRLAELRVGPQPVPYKSLTPARLGAAIAALCSSPVFQENATRVGEQLQAEDGIHTAVRLIEQQRLHHDSAAKVHRSAAWNE